MLNNFGGGVTQNSLGTALLLTDVEISKKVATLLEFQPILWRGVLLCKIENSCLNPFGVNSALSSLESYSFLSLTSRHLSSPLAQPLANLVSLPELPFG